MRGTAEKRDPPHAPLPGARLRTFLAAITVLLLVPPLAFAGFALWGYAGSERARVAGEAQALAHAKANALEVEIAALAAAAQTLGGFPPLRSGDLRAFHARAAEVAAERGAAALVLRDGAGRRVVDTAVAFGAPLPPDDGRTPSWPDGEARALLAEGRPVLSGLHADPVLGRPLLRVAVPAAPFPGAGAGVATLEAAFAPERLAAALARGGPAEGWLVVAVDRAGRIVARNPRHEEFLGREATPDLLEHTRLGPAGTWRGVTLEGTPALGAFARTPTGGLRVVAGVPLAVLEAPVRRSLLLFAGVGGALVALGLCVPLVLARRVERCGRDLAAAAGALGAGEPVAVAATPIREGNAIAAAMASASAALRERERSEREARAAAERGRELLQSVVDGVSDPVFVKDRGGRYALANRAAAAALGRTVAEVLGRSDAELMPPATARRVEATDRAVLGVAAPARAVEAEVVLPDPEGGGAERVFVSAKSAWRGPDGGLLGVIGVARDVTERRRDERRVRALEAQLQRVARRSTVGAMASGLAHELNQPLAAVAMWLRGAGRLLAPEAPAGGGGPSGERLAQARDALDSAAAQALRAGEIVRRLRDFVGRGETERRPEPVGPMVREAAALAAAGEDAAVEYGLDDAALGAALADRVQVQQVVVNLVRNAAEAVRGRPRREVRVSAARVPGPGAKGGPEVEVAVADTGPGLAPEVEGRLFESFVSTKEDGMGVGLSICRAIVEAHGGRLWAAPAAPGEGGMVFRFTLPALPAPPAPPAEETGAREPAAEPAAEPAHA